MSPTTPPPAHPLSLWPAFGLGLSVAAGNGLARFAYALVLPAMRDDLRWTYAQAGWLGTANALGYILGAISGYVLLRRLRPSQLFTYGLVLVFVPLLLTGLHADHLWLTTTRIAAGVGTAWAFACGGALVAARYQHHPALRGTATGVFFAGGGIGIALAGVCVNPLLAYTGSAGWPGAWLMLGGLATLASIWPMREARRIGGSANETSSEAMDLRGLWPSLLSYFLVACGYIVYMTFIFAWMRDQQLSWQFGTAVWLMLGGSAALSPFVWRRALDAWHPGVTLAASSAAMLLGTLLPILSASAASVLLSAACFGASLFIAPAAVAVLIRKTMAPGQWAKGMIFYTVLFAVGQAIGPVLSGWVADHSSLNASMVFAAALLGLAGGLALVGLKRVATRMG
jgi:predicted MFS family arabinose efflux permease